jgi:hypothetical protein
MKCAKDIILAILLMIMVNSCIKNDIPYPRIQANFLTMEVDGQSRAVSIDSINRIVDIELDENTDIKNVIIKSYTITPNAVVVGSTLDQPINLTMPITATLRLYQDYNWTIRATQDIVRYFTVASQIGSSTIDVPGHRVVAYVPKGTDLTHIEVLSMKLAPSNADVYPDIEGQTIDFSKPVSVDVSLHGTTETWTIYIETTETTVSTTRVDAWTNVAFVYGEAEVGKDNGIEYRRKNAGEWTKVPTDWLVFDGGSYYARILHLNANTEYEARAYSNDEYGAVLEFTTGSSIQIPNSTFDNWWLDGKVWCPWGESDEQYWDTGNKGATTLGSSNSYPTTDTPSGSGYAACLETRFVGIGVIGKLAAGNMFLGKYVKTDGTNGILSFGREFTERPTKLKGKYKYTTAPISSTTTGFDDLKGQPDTCIVWCALIDSDEPFEIRTNPNNRQLFNASGSYVVGYGKMEVGNNVEKWTQFEFEINYTATNRKPKYILITASASKYGDYFTGGNGAVLCVDDFELEYDY